MIPAEDRLLSFVTTRIESMLHRSALWGSLLSVEEQILQLLELRRVLLAPSFSADDTHKLLRSYSRFVSETLEDSTVEPLATQLEQRGRAADFPAFMKKFIELEFAEFFGDAVPSEGPVIEGSPETLLDKDAMLASSAAMQAELRHHRAILSALAAMVDQTDPADPIGTALTRAGLAVAAESSEHPESYWKMR